MHGEISLPWAIRRVCVKVNHSPRSSQPAVVDEGFAPLGHPVKSTLSRSGEGAEMRPPATISDVKAMEFTHLRLHLRCVCVNSMAPSGRNLLTLRNGCASGTFAAAGAVPVVSCHVSSWIGAEAVAGVRGDGTGGFSAHESRGCCRGRNPSVVHGGESPRTGESAFKPQFL